MWYDMSVPEVVPRPPHLPLTGVGVLYPGDGAVPLRRRRATDQDLGETEWGAAAEAAAPTHLVAGAYTRPLNGST